MDSVTSTADLYLETKSRQENILLALIKELCAENSISAKLKGKVTRIMADCDLAHHSSLHKLSAADESTTSLLGFMQQTSQELTFDEQTELNQAIAYKIKKKLPSYMSELDQLQKSRKEKISNREQLKTQQKSLDENLEILKEQENEKVEIMMEWLNHRLGEISQFRDNSSELLTLKTRILELKSKILHLQILQNIYTETNQSMKAYSEVHKDLKDSIKKSEENIKHFKEMIQKDFSQYT